VELGQLTLAIRSYLEYPRPKEIYLPYSLALIGRSCLRFLVKRLNRLGVTGRLPAETMFMEFFFKTQTLSSEKLRKASYGDPYFETTVYTELPDIIQYYVERWQLYNLLSSDPKTFVNHSREVDGFIDRPGELLDSTMQEEMHDDFGNMTE
jgi:hypothetical protein